MLLECWCCSLLLRGCMNMYVRNKNTLINCYRYFIYKNLHNYGVVCLFFRPCDGKHRHHDLLGTVLSLTTAGQQRVAEVINSCRGGLHEFWFRAAVVIRNFWDFLRRRKEKGSLYAMRLFPSNSVALKSLLFWCSDAPWGVEIIIIYNNLR